MKRLLFVPILLLFISAQGQDLQQKAVGIWMGGMTGGIKISDTSLSVENAAGWEAGGGVGIRIPVKFYNLSIDIKGLFSGKSSFRYCGELNFVRMIRPKIYAYAGPNITFWKLQFGPDTKGGPGFQLGAGYKVGGDENSSLLAEAGFKYMAGKIKLNDPALGSTNEVGMHSSTIFFRVGFLFHSTK
ncbi:exported hypothetical protein [Candidatus Zixiibacteriota bacterium]|nr:exported hypothetical protein [candidate division Zixibacteria bacterium]